VFAVSIAVVSLTPAKAMVDQVGSDKGAEILALVAAASALFEIVISPVVGALSDTFGRKPMLLGTFAAVALVQSITALSPTVQSIAVSKFVCSLVSGLFFLTSGAILADSYQSSPGKLAASTGLLTALIFGGSSCGVFVSTRLPPATCSTYVCSAAAALLSLLYATLFVRESVPAKRRVPFVLKSISPLSGFRLLRLSRRARNLTLLLALSLQPLFMGDVLQVYMIDQWKLQTAAVMQLVMLRQIAGMAANSVSGKLIGMLGVRSFAAIAFSSELTYWLGFSTSHSWALLTAALGWLGPARALSANTMITAEGARLGIPQGLLAGYKANFVAVLKVIGPLIHGKLYVLGKKRGTPQLPFMLNGACTLLALAFSVFALAPVPAAAVAKSAGGGA